MLISTSSLDLIVTGAKVMVDGAVFDFKIVEEGGFSLGEDACLSDEEESQEDLERGEDRNFDELNAHGDVDNLLNHLAEEWKTEKQDSQACQTSPLKEFPSVAAVAAECQDDILSGSAEIHVHQNPMFEEDTSQHVFGCAKSSGEGDSASDNRQSRNGLKGKVQRTSSCPPGRVHAVSAGPWSLEWACRHKDVEIGDVTQMVPKGVSKCSQGAGRVTRKKGGGVSFVIVLKT